MGGGPAAGVASAIGVRRREYVGLAAGAGFTVLVVASSLVNRWVGSAEGGFTGVWPAGGLPVIWLMMRGASLLSMDTALLGVVIVVANLVSGGAPDLAVSFAVANLAQCWIVVVLLRRWCAHLWGFGGRRPLGRPGDVAYLGVALIAASGVGVAVGSLGAALLPGHDGRFDAVASGLWFGRNLASGLIVVALGNLIGSRIAMPVERESLRGRDGGRVELVTATAFTIAMYAVAFYLEDLPLAFLTLAATVWFGARFSTLLIAAHSLVVGLATALLTLADLGPFARVDHADLGLMIAQFYVATLVVTGLAIGTGRDERQALADDLRRAQEDTAYEETVRAAVIGSMIEGVLVVDETGELLKIGRAHV